MGASSWGSVRQLPSKKWQAFYRRGGKRFLAPTTFATKTMARAWLAKEQTRIMQEAAGFTPPKEEALAGETITLHKAFLAWINNLEEKNYSPNTLRTYRSTYTSHIKDHWQGYTLTAITYDAFQEWDETKKWESPNIRKKTVMCLRSLISFCVKKQWLKTNPIPSVSGQKNPRVRDFKVLTADEVNAVRECMPSEFAVLVDLAAWCAMRFGEIQALQRRDLDLDKGVVRVNKAVKRGVGGYLTVGPPKSRAGVRDVMIPPKCLERIRTHLDQHVDSGADALVVHMAGKPDKFLTNKAMHTFYDRALKTAGVEKIRFHDLRHTGLTLAAQAGATLAELMHRAGHSDPKTVMIYQHSTLERDQLIAERLGG